MGIFSLVTGKAGESGFGSASTAEQVTQGIDASKLTVIVTGGASGIGLETARVLALRNAHVIIAARNTDAAVEAKQLILQDHNARVDVLKLDLCSFESIKAFADSFKALNLPLNILINNAGLMFCPYQLSENGLEIQFATNHLGHFLLTNLLLDKMKETAKSTGVQGRIVNLSSVAHQTLTYDEGIRFDMINDEKSYSDKKAYGQSKLANILHANELSRRLQEEGANITVNSVHPGLIMTKLYRHSAILFKFVKLVTPLIWKNIPQGAATTCYVALHPKLKGVTGKYFADCNEMEPSIFATDEKMAKNLWELSSKLVSSAHF